MESGGRNGEDEIVRYEATSGVATLTLNNPEARNGWNRQMEERYFSLLDWADGDEHVRVIVVTGAPEGKAFCPGLDMRSLEKVSGGPGLDRSGRRPMHRALEVRKPMIAAINGACAGLGLTQALFCDLRFAARGARFSTAFARRGLPAEYGVSWILPRLMGLDKALDLLLSARTLEADEALALGLVTRVYEPDELMDATYAYAEDLAVHCSPRSMMAIRSQTRRHLEVGFDEAMVETLALMAQYNAPDNPDFREGVASFIERRAPGFGPIPDDFTLSYE